MLTKWFVSPEKLHHALVVFLRGVDGRQDSFVSVTQGLGMHLRDEVHGEVGVVARERLQQPFLFPQPVVQPRVDRSIEQPHHRNHNAAFPDEVDQ